MDAVAGLATLEQIQVGFAPRNTQKDKTIAVVLERLQAMQEKIAAVKAGLELSGADDKRQIEALGAELEGEHAAFVELTARVTEQADKIVVLEGKKMALLAEIGRVEARHAGHRHHYAAEGLFVAGPNQ